MEEEDFFSDELYYFMLKDLSKLYYSLYVITLYSSFGMNKVGREFVFDEI